jgi:hypothetical protein
LVQSSRDEEERIGRKASLLLSIIPSPEDGSDVRRGRGMEEEERERERKRYSRCWFRHRGFSGNRERAHPS